MSSQVDHLVVVAHSLAQGVAWCEQTLGITPGPGGRHPLMGTHNRLLALGAPEAGTAQPAPYPHSYLEIIAMDPDAPPPGRARWFGMDQPAVQAAVRQQPQLVHLVARTQALEMLRWGLINLGLDPGPPLAAQRDTPQGRLAWRILVRDDGAIAASGTLPTLIEWQGHHPAEAMPPSGWQLQAVRLGGLQPRARDVLRLRSVVFDDAPAPHVQVTLRGPAGEVELRSLG